MKFSAWYGIIVGLLMVSQWTFFIATGSVPELQTAPCSIGFHLGAEFLTALALTIGGIAILKSKRWGVKTMLVALGMVIYSEIASPGYFAQQGVWGLVAMFEILLLGAIIALSTVKMKN